MNTALAKIRPPRPLEDYENHLRCERGLAQTTVCSYLADAERFLEYLGTTGLQLHQVDVCELTRWLLKQEAGRVDPRTLARQRSALRAFFGFQVLQGRLPSNPAKLLDLPRIPRRLPRAPKPEDLDVILAGCDPGDACGLRDLTMYQLIFDTGLRASELCSLRLGGLSFEHEEIRVVGKGDKERIVFLSKRSARSLKLYLKQARPLLLGEARSSYLFLSHWGRPISRKTLWSGWHQLCARAGIHSTVHGIRHAFATALLNGGADIRHVQELLGHADIMTTAIYLHVDGRMAAVHARYHPRA